MIRINRFHQTDGSATVTAAVLAGVLTILVAGFLVSISNQYTIDNRTSKWQQALYLAEAGLETGLSELNYHYVTGSDPFGTGRGWVSVSGSVYSKTVSNLVDTNGEIIGDYSVTVSNVSSANPVLFATGTSYNSRGPNVTRMISITTKKQSSGYGLLAKTGISFTNPSFIVDSYDSTDPTKSTGGLYDAAKKQANALMGTQAGTMDLKGAVYGKLTISGSGTVSAIQSLGNTTNAAQRATTVPTAISLGYITTVSSVSLPTPTVPFSSSTSLPAINGNYTLTGSGDYTCPSLSANNGQTITINGNVRLYIPGNITLSGGAITIPAGSHLELYVDGKITMTGSSALNNNNRADQCLIYGTGAANTWSLTGSSGFYAVLYAPDYYIKFTGATGFSGMMVGNSFSTTGAGYFHYDESLSGGGASAPYSTASWKEYRIGSGGWVVD